MKRIISLFLVTVLITIFSCNQGAGNKTENSTANDSTAVAGGGQENVNDNESQKLQYPQKILQPWWLR